MQITNNPCKKGNNYTYSINCSNAFRTIWFIRIIALRQTKIYHLYFRIVVLVLEDYIFVLQVFCCWCSLEKP